jgi:hypothetical protein
VQRIHIHQSGPPKGKPRTRALSPRFLCSSIWGQGAEGSKCGAACKHCDRGKEAATPHLKDYRSTFGEKKSELDAPSGSQRSTPLRSRPTMCPVSNRRNRRRYHHGRRGPNGLRPLPLRPTTPLPGLPATRAVHCHPLSRTWLCGSKASPFPHSLSTWQELALLYFAFSPPSPSTTPNPCSPKSQHFGATYVNAVTASPQSPPEHTETRLVAKVSFNQLRHKKIQPVVVVRS